MIRKATREDLPRIIEIYEDVHTMEELGDIVIGWQRDVYPTRWTAEDALTRDDLYVLESPDGEIVATAIIRTAYTPRRNASVFSLRNAGDPSAAPILASHAR